MSNSESLDFTSAGAVIDKQPKPMPALSHAEAVASMNKSAATAPLSLADEFKFDLSALDKPSTKEKSEPLAPAVEKAAPPASSTADFSALALAPLNFDTPLAPPAPPPPEFKPVLNLELADPSATLSTREMTAATLPPSTLALEAEQAAPVSDLAAASLMPAAAPAAHPAPQASPPMMATTATKVLSVESEEELKQAATAGQINLAQYVDAEDRGCQILVSLLCQGGETKLTGAGRFIGVLAKKTLARHKDDQNIWLLLLEIYQRLGRKTQFNDAAARFSQLFDEDAPRWNDSAIGRCEI